MGAGDSASPMSLIERMPRERVLPETDGPFARDAAGRPLHPTNAREVPAGVAELWGESTEVVAERMAKGASAIRAEMHQADSA